MKKSPFISNQFIKFFPLLVIVLASINSCTPQSTWIKNQGSIFGTTYHLVYESPKGEDHHEKVRAALDSVNHALSTYDTTSIISRFNRSEHGSVINEHFRNVFLTAKEVTSATNGAFDMSVAPLVNAWGFGFSNKLEMTPAIIDSLKALVGMEYVAIKQDSIIRHRHGVMLDASAIAKGYGADVAAATLNRLGCSNYMVEIGGEVSTKGNNPRGNHWRIGIDRPIDDPSGSKRELELIVELSGQALATSGNYRQFYIDEKDGKKYAHTIDPKSGKPVDHSLLSASIIGENAMLADAYATACMVMGLEKSMDLIKKHPKMEGCFIHHTKEGMKVTWSEGFETYIAK